MSEKMSLNDLYAASRRVIEFGNIYDNPELMAYTNDGGSGVGKN